MHFFMTMMRARLAQLGWGLGWLLMLPLTWAGTIELPANTVVSHFCARLSAKDLDQRAQPYQTAIQKYAAEYQVSEAVIKAVIAIESCYNQQAESPKGAQGLMQLIPETAERFGVADSMNSQQNIKGGTRYLAWLWKRFDGDLPKVLAAYNAGEGRVDQYQGIPPYRETQAYVRNVLFVHNKLVGMDATPKQPVLPDSIGLIQPAVVNSNTPPAILRPVGLAPLAPAPTPRRVVTVFQSPFKLTRPAKPGRAGLLANKARAPQLYKQ